MPKALQRLSVERMRNVCEPSATQQTAGDREVSERTVASSSDHEAISRCPLERRASARRRTHTRARARMRKGTTRASKEDATSTPDVQQKRAQQCPTTIIQASDTRHAMCARSPAAEGRAMSGTSTDNCRHTSPPIFLLSLW